MNKNKIKNTLKNILKVAFSNIFTVIAGVIVGFILPKIIGITNYGYYKTFSLYITYVSLFQLGISEGIYLKYGGYSYEELDKSKFRFYTHFFIIMEIVTSIILGIISLFSFENDYKFIFIAVSIFIMFQNITTYYQYISQITNRFNELSIRNIIKSVLTIIAVLGMWIYYKNNGEMLLSYKIYTICYILIFAALMIWYIHTYRDITFGKKEKPTQKEETILYFLKLGFPLLLANLCSTLALNVDRQFVSMFFDIDTYGSYAFAYNLISLITVATSAIGVVIYPQIKGSNKNLLIEKYDEFLAILIGFILLCCSVYFPLCKFMEIFFAEQQKYIDSLPIFRIILPSLAITCSIGILIQTYYKTFDYNKQYFCMSIVILILSVVANGIAYFFSKTTEAISIASVIVFIIWYIIVSLFLKNKIKINWKKTFAYLITGMITFYSVSSFSNWLIDFVVYIVLFVFISYIFYRKKIKLYIKKGVRNNESY